MSEYQYESIGNHIEVCVSQEHTFGTDAFLLSHFAAPKRKDITCDLGTGCGIIPLLWMRSAFTKPKKSFAVDIQPQAIEQLTITKMRSGLESLTPILCDLREISKHLPAGSIDLVTCNPPYNSAGSGLPSEQDSDRIARHETLCTTDDVCRAANWLLRFGGRLCICQLPERLVDVLSSMRTFQIEPKRIRMVQQNPESAPWLVLVEGKRGAKPFLIIEPPLIMKIGDQLSPEMQKIYQLYGNVNL